MSSFTVYFPDGSKEFRYPTRPLKEGDTLWHDGERYRVLSVQEQDGRALIVTVEPDSADLGDLLRSEEGALQLVPVE